MTAARLQLGAFCVFCGVFFLAPVALADSIRVFLCF